MKECGNVSRPIIIVKIDSSEFMSKDLSYQFDISHSTYHDEHTFIKTTLYEFLVTVFPKIRPSVYNVIRGSNIVTFHNGTKA